VTKLQAPYSAPMTPVYPCREMETRPCPAVYADVCGDRPCARFESDSGGPWLPEVIDLPNGRCGDTEPHEPHPVMDTKLGAFWCSGR
jgi:hypothetical protein